MNKETVMINADIKSGDELARRLMAGEVFWTESLKKIRYGMTRIEITLSDSLMIHFTKFGTISLG